MVNKDELQRVLGPHISISTYIWCLTRGGFVYMHIYIHMDTMPSLRHSIMHVQDKTVVYVCL